MEDLKNRAKIPLKARFIGSDSLGYKHNVPYSIFFGVNPNGSLWIERQHKSCDIDGYCLYGSFESFLRNWEVSV